MLPGWPCLFLLCSLDANASRMRADILGWCSVVACAALYHGAGRENVLADLREQACHIGIALFVAQALYKAHAQTGIVEVALEVEEVGLEGQGAAFDEG